MAVKLFSIKTIFTCIIISFLLICCANAPSTSRVAKIPITIKGDMSTAVLALAKHQNVIYKGENAYNFPDGLVFFFVIYPAGSNSIPTIKQFQNFTINGEFYWQSIPDLYNSQTIIYNEQTFAQHEPDEYLNIKLRKNTKAFIQKTVICGPPIPAEGVVLYRLFFGFEDTVEEFDFCFSLADIQ